MDHKFYINSIVLITTFLALDCLNSEETSRYLTTLSRTGKQYRYSVSRIGMVRFQNDLCTGYGSLSGTCYTRKQCTAENGVASSRCANSTGVCCVITRTCGESSKINNTYFVSPGFPSTYSGSGVCKYTVQKIDDRVCQIRIDFLTLKLAQPNANGICNSDALVISGTASNVPVLCGENSGQHMYIDFNRNSDIVITIETSGTAYKAWNIRVTQINCNCPYRAPSGCLQHFNSTTGTVTSFNYGSAATQNGTRQLANENYGICIAMITGYCGIKWSQTDALPFSVSNDTYTYIANGTVGSINSEQFGTNCTTDFIVIPSPAFTNTTALNTDRFCGNGFATVTSNSKPFVLNVVTNENEVSDMGNLGFSLNFVQTRCSIFNTN